MPLKFKNIPKSPHKTIWYHLMNFFVPHILSAEIRTFEEPCAKDLLIVEKKWHSLKFFHHIDLCTLHYFHSFCNKTPWLLRKESAFSKKLPLNFPLHNSVTPTEKIRVFQKKLQKTLTLWPIFGPKIGLLVRFLDHMMQNFKYNRRLTLVILWTSLKVRYKPTGPAPNSQPHPSLFFLTSAGHSTELFWLLHTLKRVNLLLSTPWMWITQTQHWSE